MTWIFKFFINFPNYLSDKFSIVWISLERGNFTTPLLPKILAHENFLIFHNLEAKKSQFLKQDGKNHNSTRNEEKLP